MLLFCLLNLLFIVIVAIALSDCEVPIWILKTRVFQYLGSSSDWLKPCFIQSEALPRSYVLYHPIHGKSRPDGCKILFHKYAAKANQSRKSPLPHEIRTLARDRKAWKRMEVDCWHHRESPSVPRKDRESVKILRSLLRRHLKGKAAITVTKCWMFFSV